MASELIWALRACAGISFATCLYMVVYVVSMIRASKIRPIAESSDAPKRSSMGRYNTLLGVSASSATLEGIPNPAKSIAEVYADISSAELLRAFHLATGRSERRSEDRPDIVDAKHEYRLKRSVDIVGSLTATIAFLPLMVAVAIVVAMTSRGPVLFRQTRLGKSGVPFTMYRFRSMRLANDDRIHEFSSDLVGWNAYATKFDPRLTKVGRFMRRTAIDELPSLINVLRGEMSLVGPRPLIPYEAAQYEAWHMRRLLTVRPGMTGLSQIRSRNAGLFQETMRIDLRYVSRASLLLDLRVMMKTIHFALSGRIEPAILAPDKQRTTTAVGQQRIHSKGWEESDEGKSAKN